MYTLIRLGSVGGVAALRWLLPPMAYFSLFVAMLFGHYVLATLYGRRRAEPLLRGQVPVPLVVAFALLVVVPPLLMLPAMVLFLYFGAHHALSEGYMVLGRGARPRDAAERRLLVARMVLTYLVYVAAIVDEPMVVDVIDLSHATLFVPLAVAFVVFLVVLVPVARRLSRRELLDLLSFETVGVATACIVFLTPIRFFDAAFYHLLVWLYLPLVQAGSRRGQLRYLVHVALATGPFFVLTPWVGYFGALDYPFWVLQSFMWAYVHISTSVVLSGYNPLWLTRLFLPRTAARA
jgi:hypothetical protein